MSHPLLSPFSSALLKFRTYARETKKSAASKTARPSGNQLASGRRSGVFFEQPANDSATRLAEKDSRLGVLNIFDWFCAILIQVCMIIAPCFSTG
jgi:hypothetical protein